VDGWRRWLLAALVAVVAVGCGQPSPLSAYTFRCRSAYGFTCRSA
jgi:hypothetical protein